MIPLSTHPTLPSPCQGEGLGGVIQLKSLKFKKMQTIYKTFWVNYSIS